MDHFDQWWKEALCLRGEGVRKANRTMAVELCVVVAFSIYVWIRARYSSELGESFHRSVLCCVLSSLPDQSVLFPAHS